MGESAMSGPWEKYKAAEPQGPWAKYQAPGSYEPEQSLGQSLKELGHNAKEGLADLLTLSQQKIPGMGILDKVGAANYAAQQEIGDLFRDEENTDTFSNRYQKVLKDVKSERQIAAERSPTADILSNIVAAAPNMAVPIPGAGMKGLAGIATRIGGNAALSAIDQGTRGDELWDSEKAKQAATLTGEIQAGVEALPYVGKAIKGATKPVADFVAPKLKSAAGAVAKKGMKVALGVPEEDAAYYLANAEGVNAAKSLEDIKNIVDDSVGKLQFDMGQKKLSQEAARRELERLESRLIETFQDRKFTLKEAQAEAKDLLGTAWNQTLDKMKAVKPPAELRQQIMDDLANLRSSVSKGSGEGFDALEKSGVSVKTPRLKGYLSSKMNELKIGGASPVGEQSAAFSKLKAYRDMLDEMPGEIPATEAKKLVQAIDADLKKLYQAGSADYSPMAARSLKDFRGSIDDVLKENAPYAETMSKVAPDAKALNKALDMGLGDEASLIGLLNSVNTPKGELTLKMLDELGQRTGTNYRGAIQEYIDTQAKLGSREAMDQLKRNLPEYKNLEKVNKALSFLDKPRTEEITRRVLNMSPQQKALKAASDEASDTAQLAKQFSGWTPANTESKLKSVMQGMGNGGKIQQTKEIEALSNMTGVDFKELLKNRRVADLFEKGYRNGSRNVNLWSILSSASKLGNMDQVIGAITGASIDSFGPKMGKKLMDSYLKVQKLAQSDGLKSLGKYAGVLSNAAKRGNASLTATHYMLMQDPQYRKAIGE
jgi:hypothetical protein